MQVDNAISGAKREIRQRYDLAGSKCDLDRKDNALTIIVDDHMKLEQVNALLRKYLTSRKVEIGAFVFGNPEEASGQTWRHTHVLSDPFYLFPNLGHESAYDFCFCTGIHLSK